MKLNTIYNEKAEETLLRMPDEFIDLTVTSPPYDELRKYSGFAFDIDTISNELFRVTKSGGVVVWVVSDETKNHSESGTSFRTVIKFMEAGWNLYDTMIYKKKNFMTTNHRRYEQEFEFMFVFSKGRIKTFNPIKVDCVSFGKNHVFKKGNGRKVWNKEDRPRSTLKQKNKGNIWEYACGLGGSTSDKIAFKHPAIFSELLASDHIKSWSNKEEIVYDPFSGSGTVAKMAHMLSRRFIGSEMSSEYHAIGNQRLLPYLRQTKLL